MSSCVTESPSSARALAAIHAESDRQRAEDDVSCTRPAVAALKAIRQCDLTPVVIVQLLNVLSATVARAPWACTQEGEMVQGVIDDLADDLRYGK